MAGNACDFFNFGQPFGGNSVPLDYGSARNPQAMSHLGQEASFRSNQFHAVNHGACLPEGSGLGKRKCLPLVFLGPATTRPMEIGNRIALARTLAGLSQTALADAVQVSRGLVGQWESHKKKPGRENLAKIAKVTLVSMAYLMGEESKEQISITVRDSDQIDLLRRYSQLDARQRQNLKELLGMTIEIRQEIEKQRGPVEGEHTI